MSSSERFKVLVGLLPITLRSIRYRFSDAHAVLALVPAEPAPHSTIKAVLA